MRKDEYEAEALRAFIEDYGWFKDMEALEALADEYAYYSLFGVS